MTFSKYACWKPEMLRKVMDVEATQPDEHIFLATHSPIKMYFQGIEDSQGRKTADEEEFIKTFLSTSDFIFVSILGTSGAGKSHLIRWLYTRIKSIRKAPDYRVLIIPKVGTNLRDILELILADLEGPEFDEYRNRLRQAANTLTEAEAREQILANLAIAVGSSGRHNRSNLSDEQNYLIESLPALLHDPFFREHWLREEGIIHQLVVHTLGHHDSIEIVEERRQFSLEDLPLNVLNINNASAQARDFYSYLISDDDLQKATVSWLNTHLDEAIAKVLNLGREDLQRLMLDVRRALARKNVELILLIEDFAKLQGIDREVLEAVLARPQQGEGEPLCAMRTALACTTGYFKGMVDTVRTRTDFIVNLDVETVDEQSLVTPADVEQLAARYLNAVRLQDQDIRHWLSNVNEETENPLDPVPNACTDCEHQSSCHAGFGAVDGMGLYPFSAVALEKMRKRTSAGGFNPRMLIKDVLRYTLEYHRSDLEQGRFPSTLLLDHFGGSKLSAILSNEIKTKDPLNADRREVLLNLWSDGQMLCDLALEIHTAFVLPPIYVGPFPPPPPLPPPPPPPPLPPVDQNLERYIEDLNQWRTGTPLPSPVATELRPKLFSAIKHQIDFDASLILQSHVIGNLFKQRNITFFNATTSVQVKNIELCLPLNSEDLGDTTIALQALLLYDHYKDWKFPDGATYFRVYARKLEEWSQYVLQSVPKCSTKSRRDGDLVPAVVELLAITSRMAGYTTTSLEDLVNAVFTDLENVDFTDRSGTWKKLFSSLKRYQPELRKILESRVPCTKGGSSRLQMIDAVQLIGPLKAVSSTWSFQVDISDVSADSPFDAVSKARKEVDELLMQAVKDERERHLVVYQRVLKELGEDFSQKEVVDELQATIKQIQDVGVAGGVNLNDLNTAMDEFKKANLKAYINSLERLQEIEPDNVAMLLPLLSTLRERPVKVITNFLDLACKLVARAQDSAQGSLATLRTTGAVELEESCQNIETHLMKLQNLANDIKGESVCS